MSKTKLKLVRDNEISICGEQPPLIKPGIYSAVYIKRDLRTLHGKTGKIVAKFKIITPGDYFETILYRYWNAKSINKHQGTFQVGWKSAFVREYVTLFGEIKKLSHISMALFKGKVFKVEVSTVKHGSYNRKPIPEAVQYSVISEVTSLETG